jgi:hypothetical protein
MSYVTVNGVIVDLSRASYGGDSRDVSSQLSSDVVEIFSTAGAFAALKVDGSVVTWGGVEGLIANDQWFRDLCNNVTMSEPGVNVGIGRTSPIATLEVSGTTLFGLRDSDIEPSNLLFYGIDTYGRNSGIVGDLRRSIVDIKTEATFSAVLYKDGSVRIHTTSGAIPELAGVASLSSIVQIETTPLQIYARNQGGTVYAYSANTTVSNPNYDPNGAVSIHNMAQISDVASGSFSIIAGGSLRTFTFSVGVTSTMTKTARLYCSELTLSNLSTIGAVPGFYMSDLSGITDVSRVDIAKTTDPTRLFAIVLYTDGRLHGFGNVPSGFTNINIPPMTPPQRIMEVAVGEEHITIRRANGTVTTWDPTSASYSVSGLNGLTDIIRISSGYRHAIAITKDYHVITSGTNTEGQTDISGHSEIHDVFGGYNVTFGVQKRLYHRFNGETRLADTVSIGRQHYGDTKSQLNIYPAPHHPEQGASVYIGSNTNIGATESHYSRVTLADDALPETAHQWHIGHAHTAVPDAEGDHQLVIQHSRVGDVRNIMRIDTCGNIGIGNTTAVITHLVDIRGGDVNVDGTVTADEFVGTVRTASQPFIQELGTRVGIGKTWNNGYNMDVSGTARITNAVDICGQTTIYDRLRIVNGGVSISNTLDVSGTTTIDGKTNLRGTDGVWVKNNLDVSGTSRVIGNTTICGTLFVTDICGFTGSQWTTTTSGIDIYYTQGLVGIARSDPSYPLDVSGHTRIKGTLYVDDISSSQTLSQWKNAQTGTAIYYKDGPVGIGLSDPSSSYVLDVSGTANFGGAIRFGELVAGIGTDESLQIDICGESDFFQFGRQSTLLVDPSLNHVGIGMTNPLHRLHVNGNAKVEGTLFVTDICGIDFGGNRSAVSSQWVSVSGNDIYYEGGKVGIGTSSPVSKLQVYSAGNANIEGNIPIWDDSFMVVGNATTSSGVSSGSVGIGYNSISNAGILACVAPDSAWKDMVYYADKHRFMGNVGVGLTNPSVALDVSGTVRATTLTGTLSTASQPNVTSVGTLGSLSVSGNLTVDSNTLVVDASNNRVGVGLTNPSVALDVSGTVRATTLTGTLSTASQPNVTSVGTLGSLSVSGNLTVDSNTLVVDASNNRVGINNTNPSAVLDVNGDTIVSGNLTVDSNTLVVDASNNRVGIGKSDPSVALDISGYIITNVLRTGGSATNFTTSGTTQYISRTIQEFGSFAISGSFFGVGANVDFTINYSRSYGGTPLVFCTHLSTTTQAFPLKIYSINSTSVTLRLSNAYPSTETYTGSIFYQVVGMPA